MQVFMSIIFFIVVIMFGISSQITTNPLTSQKIASTQAQGKAQNIIDYNTAANQFIINNWGVLAELKPLSLGEVENYQPISYANLTPYFMLVIKPSFTYNIVSFNYTKLTGLDTYDSQQKLNPPAVFLFNTFDIDSTKYNPDEVMGQLGELSSQQQTSGGLNQNVPIIGSQSGCQIQQIYSQYTQNSDSGSNEIYVQDTFKDICNKLTTRYGLKISKYFYLQQITKRNT